MSLYKRMDTTIHILHRDSKIFCSIIPYMRKADHHVVCQNNSHKNKTAPTEIGKPTNRRMYGPSNYPKSPDSTLYYLNNIISTLTRTSIRDRITTIITAALLET